MSKVAIITDSNSGITLSEAKELNIQIIPMPFTIDREEYLEGVNLSEQQFYDKLLSDCNVSTSQPSLNYIKEVWDKTLKEYDEIVYIPMSSALSNSFETAYHEALKHYQNKVFVVDNQRISVTLKLAVFDALKLARNGYSGQQIHDILMETALNADIYIMVDTLKYLKKGGRITAAAAKFGSLLKIKPVLKIKANKLDTFKMTNRTYKGAIRVMIDAIKNNINGYLKDLDGRTDNVTLGVAYTGLNNPNVELLVSAIKEEFKDYPLIINPLPLSITCHVGDGVIGMGVIKNLPDKYL